MIRQYIFMYILYLLGLIWGLSFKKLPMLFVFLSGFLWGAIIWVIASFFGLLVFRFFVPVNIFIISIFISAAFLVPRLAEIRANWRQLARWFIGSSFLFLLFSYLLHRFNFTNIGPDSVVFIVNGRQIFFQGLSELTKNEMVLRGVFLPLIQSASVMTRFQYLSSFAPMISVTFVVTFFYLCWFSTKRIDNNFVRIFFVLLTALSLVSIPIFLEHLFYVHVNLPSATYFSVAVICLWLALLEKNEDWFILGVVALTGFNLLRIEAPIFSIAVLVLVVHKEEIGYKYRLFSLLPFSLFFIAYYSYLTFLLSGNDTYILSPARSMVIVVMYSMLLVYFFILKTKLLPKILVDWLPALMVGVLVLAIGLFFVYNPSAMKSAVSVWFNNLVTNGFWGGTWYILIPALIIFSLLKGSMNEHLFIYWIILFVLILILINFQAYPIHYNNSGDSANRIMIHIVPVIYYYFLIKWVDLYQSTLSNSSAPVQQ